MFYTFKGDLVFDINGNLVEDKRYDGTKIVDITERVGFYIDYQGIKHIKQLDPSWKYVECKWNDELVYNPESGWQLKTEEEKLNELKVKEISKLIDIYQKYLLSRESILRLIGFTSLIVRTLVVLNTNKSLTDEQVDTLSQIIEDCDKIFLWISNVTDHELEIENLIRNATSIQEIYDAVAKINFAQFDKQYPQVSLGDKLQYLQSLNLVEE